MNYKFSILILVCLTIFSCNFFAETGRFGLTNSMDESIQKKVFIHEYKPLQNPTKINDTLEIQIESCWLERNWRYAGFAAEKAEIVKGDSCQIKILAKDLKGFNEKWQIEKLNFSDYFYQGYLNSIVGDFSSIPKNDTLRLKIYRGRNPQEISANNFLGEIKLIKR